MEALARSVARGAVRTYCPFSEWAHCLVAVLTVWSLALKVFALVLQAGSFDATAPRTPDISRPPARIDPESDIAPIELDAAPGSMPGRQPRPWGTIMSLVGCEGDLGRLPIRGVDQPFRHQQQDRK